MEEKVYVLYYDLPAIHDKIGLQNFIKELIVPIMDKFEKAGKCAILLPKNEMMYAIMSKEEALRHLNEVKEHVETWQE